MEAQTVEIFKEALIESNYAPYKGDKSKRKLESACNSALKVEGPLWYPDFHSPLQSVIHTLYQENKILTYSYLRNSRYRSLERQQAELDARFSSVAINQLKGLRVEGPSSFTISSVYEILNQYFGLGHNDRLNFSFHLPEEATVDQVHAVLEKTRTLNEKRLANRPHKLEEDLKKIAERIVEGCDWSAYSPGNKYHGLCSSYKETLGRTPLAYISLSEAVNFLEDFLEFPATEKRNVFVRLRAANPE